MFFNRSVEIGNPQRRRRRLIGSCRRCVGVTGQCVHDPVADVEEQKCQRKALPRDLVDTPGGVLAVVGVVADGHLDGRRGRGAGTER